MLRFATTGLISFSPAPLRFALRIGFFVSFLSFALGIWSMIVKLTGLYEVPGWTSIVVVVTFIGGMQLIMLGVIGEYIADIHAEVKRRPAVRRRRARELPGAARAAAAGRRRATRAHRAASPATHRRVLRPAEESRHRRGKSDQRRAASATPDPEQHRVPAYGS